MGCRDIRFRYAGGLHTRSLRGRARSKSALGNRRQLVYRPHAVYRLFRADVVPAAQGVKPVSLGSYVLLKTRQSRRRDTNGKETPHCH